MLKTINLVLGDVEVVVTLVTLILALRFNLQMFQQNGYKNGEYFHWLSKNSNRQRFLWAMIITFVLQLLIRQPVIQLILIVITIVWLGAVNSAYNLYRKTETKKKLVVTARVKRLIVTFIILCALMLIFSGKYRVFCTGVFLICTPEIVILCNIINHPIEAGINRYYIRDAQKILRENPQIKLIGITGSYGKTSMKYYLNTLLKDFYDVLITPGNFNTTLGVVRTIREHLKPSNQIFLCEMGARHVHDIKEICDLFKPSEGIITSIGPQHLETFHTQENIVNTKFELADAVPEGNRVYLNADNEFELKKASEYTDKRKIIFYSYKSNKGYHASEVRLTTLGTEFTLTAPDGETARFTMRLIGEHNVINVCGAIAVAHEQGISLEKLRVPVRRIEPVPHRLQMIQRGDVTIIDDAYNSNPAGSKAAVETLHMFDGIRILVTPGMVELGEKEDDYNYKFGTYAAANCDYILLVGRISHTDPIRDGAIESGFPEARVRSFDDLQGAMNCAYGISGEGHKYILLENDLPDAY
ncbi:MAG: UDP-N-acetylmuramoyl-tripeptide--D-alanyl-D-alanine ligase [Lachnospiraceae bacterium]|uniref:UDP-N-acetylmuramoyl-tripeptide--D-alanyl-D-alanine ligase n=1 Tax=Candidatus Weimeria bifida TaxID=2599074 RepID=A0A6N7J2Q0_9FIRM|nr:UDP-N-acetylmuramoyl-tripeptide--D-alanyl-D-alanine ligase [Candidatus Weimeria bifida]RRF96418.1 MAG: UDP-N-acetylmuramoyl-tripeptide--D-alanyl-D-alanine ligase [Lachnospiraceae bacterium]